MKRERKSWKGGGGGEKKKSEKEKDVLFPKAKIQFYCVNIPYKGLEQHQLDLWQNE